MKTTLICTLLLAVFCLATPNTSAAQKQGKAVKTEYSLKMGGKEFMEAGSLIETIWDFSTEAKFDVEVKIDGNAIWQGPGPVVMTAQTATGEVDHTVSEDDGSVTISSTWTGEDGTTHTTTTTQDKTSGTKTTTTTTTDSEGNSETTIATSKDPNK
ncbi:MAG: hypothetical protein AB8G77_06285 [Rhodothermales bacterium]